MRVNQVANYGTQDNKHDGVGNHRPSLIDEQRHSNRNDDSLPCDAGRAGRGNHGSYDESHNCGSNALEDARQHLIVLNGIGSQIDGDEQNNDERG